MATTPGGPPLKHRPIASSCPAVAGNCSGGALADAGGCTSDGDCTAGVDGHCAQSQSGCACAYDCRSDGDCGAKEVCGCAASLSASSPPGSNQCLPGNCRVDGDCGANGFCSPSLGQGCIPHLVVTGYYCHTAKDACNNDSDCTAGGSCEYRPEVGNWSCFYPTCAG